MTERPSERIESPHKYLGHDAYYWHEQMLIAAATHLDGRCESVSPSTAWEEAETREEWRLKNLFPGRKPGPVMDEAPNPRHLLGCEVEHRTVKATPWLPYRSPATTKGN